MCSICSSQTGAKISGLCGCHNMYNEEKTMLKMLAQRGPIGVNVDAVSWQDYISEFSNILFFMYFSKLGIRENIKHTILNPTNSGFRRTGGDEKLWSRTSESPNECKMVKGQLLFSPFFVPITDDVIFRTLSRML